jgi:hypothetical protein
VSSCRPAQHARRTRKEIRIGTRKTITLRLIVRFELGDERSSPMMWGSIRMSQVATHGER